ncbi:phosphosulfolactate synthase [Paenibacillus sp. DYY-L-2]|uniref:phosphosulfolactate synthase n=1 Tax=Paenibacillus sp. DYY-L-2 TaxID=3447013 RepID=UPI003F505FE7
MKSSLRTVWPQELCDPSGLRIPSVTSRAARNASPASGYGLTMVIDKGLGRNSFTDLMETSSDFITCIKFGFGTAPLYKTDLLMYKIDLAKRLGIKVMPGGTLLETAVQQDVVPSFFNTVCKLGFDAIEVSDGTIELPRSKRGELIREGKERGLQVFTEYGKKISGSLVDAAKLAETLEADLKAGADLLTVEARESGIGVGIFDEKGDCRTEVIDDCLKFISDPGKLMWEAPLKNQQAMLLRRFGPGVHLGNIHPGDVLALETMRRGLRQDTFEFGIQRQEEQEFVYVI